jgi:cytosine/adenosine deaminase-related metal-dependent hydrolase
MAYKKFRANHLFTGTKMLNKDWVLVALEDGTIEDIIPFDEGESDVEFLEEGIITPGFVNCHCHLELSHLKGVIEEGSGMVDFILQILGKRFSYKEHLQDAIQAADKEMEQNGIVAVGDICNTTDSIPVKQTSNLYYHNFIEVSGFSPKIAVERFEQLVEVYNAFEAQFPNQNTLVPHAPYSVSNKLFELVQNFSKNKILSMHNQECADENAFFENKNGDFLRLYETLKVDISFFEPTGKSSLQSVLPYLQNNHSILVHNGYLTKEDLKKINQINSTQKTQFWICFCVLANRYIRNLIPQETLIQDCCNQVVIGTDSLASNHSLNILHELQYLHQVYPNVSMDILLKAATLNGAKALGIDDRMGSFTKNKKPGIMLIKNLEGIYNLLSLSH